MQTGKQAGNTGMQTSRQADSRSVTSFDRFFGHILYPGTELTQTLHHAFVHCKFLRDPTCCTTLFSQDVVQPTDLVPSPSCTTGSERQHSCDCCIPVLRHTRPYLVIAETIYFTPVVRHPVASQRAHFEGDSKPDHELS